MRSCRTVNWIGLSFLLAAIFFTFHFPPVWGDEAKSDILSQSSSFDTSSGNEINLPWEANLKITGEKMIGLRIGGVDERGNPINQGGTLEQSLWIKADGTVGSNFTVNIDYDDRALGGALPTEPRISILYDSIPLGTGENTAPSRRLQAALSNDLPINLYGGELTFANPLAKNQGLKVDYQQGGWQLSGFFSDVKGVWDHKEFRGNMEYIPFNFLEENYLRAKYYQIGLDPLDKVLVDDNRMDNNFGLTRDPNTGTYDNVLFPNQDYVVITPGMEYQPPDGENFRVLIFNILRGQDDVIRIIYADSNYEFIKGAYLLFQATKDNLDEVLINDHVAKTPGGDPEEFDLQQEGTDYTVCSAGIDSGLGTGWVIIFHKPISDDYVIKVTLTDGSTEVIKNRSSGIDQEISVCQKTVPLVLPKEIQGKYYFLGNPDIRTGSEEISSGGRRWVRLQKNASGQFVDKNGDSFTTYQPNPIDNPTYYVKDGIEYAGFYLLDYTTGILTIFRVYDGPDTGKDGYGRDSFNLNNNSSPAIPSTMISGRYDRVLTQYQLSFPVVVYSEVVKIKGPGDSDYRQLERDTDYTIDYESGIIMFLDPEKIDSSTEITIDYQYSPFGQALNTLMGLRVQFQQGDRIKVGGNFISSSSSVPLETPDFYAAPSRQDILSLDVEGKIAQWKISRDLDLRVSLLGEIAQLRSNPNVFGAALIDAMEGTNLTGSQGRWQPDQSDSQFTIFPVNDDKGEDETPPSPYYRPDYTPPPVSETEKGKVEQSLEMRVSGISGERFAFRNLSIPGEILDFSFYEKLQCWVYLYTPGNLVGDSFFLEIRGGEDSFYRYEQPISSSWIGQWTALVFPLHQPTQAKGSPLSQVTQIRIGINGDLEGILWVDELRLSGVSSRESKAWKAGVKVTMDRLEAQLAYRWIEKGFLPIGSLGFANDLGRWEATLNYQPFDFLTGSTYYMRGSTSVSDPEKALTNESFGQKLSLLIPKYPKFTAFWAIDQWGKPQDWDNRQEKLSQFYELSYDTALPKLSGINFGSLNIWSRYSRKDDSDRMQDIVKRAQDSLLNLNWTLSQGLNFAFLGTQQTSTLQDYGEGTEEIKSESSFLRGEGKVGLIKGLNFTLADDYLSQKNYEALTNPITQTITATTEITPDFVFNPLKTAKWRYQISQKNMRDLWQEGRKELENRVDTSLEYQPWKFLTLKAQNITTRKEIFQVGQTQELRPEIWENISEAQINLLQLFPVFGKVFNNSTISYRTSSWRKEDRSIGIQEYRENFSFTWKADFPNRVTTEAKYEEKRETQKPDTQIYQLRASFPLSPNLSLQTEGMWEAAKESRDIFAPTIGITWIPNARWKIANSYQAKWRDEKPVIGHETDDFMLTSTLESTYGLREKIDLKFGYKFITHTLYKGTPDDPGDYTGHEGSIQVIIKF